MRTAVERRLRGDVPVVSYISGGLDSTVVLGLSSRERGYAVPSFTIGLDRAGPDERSHAAESAAVLGSQLTTVTLNRADIVNAYPELIRAAEGPVMDSSSACLMRLASAVNQQGYKVALTGEGADEALAGYAWFKTQKIRDILRRRFGNTVPSAIRSLVLGMMGGDRAHLPDRFPIQGVRTAQQDVYDLLAQSRSFLYSSSMWNELGDHSIYDDMGIYHDRFTKWAPLNQSLYVGYKVMLAGLLLNGKGDRVAMNSSVEARYPLLDDDVIQFSTTIAPKYKLHRMTDKWLLRQVAARTLPPRIANRPKTMFRASRSEAFLDKSRPAWVDQLLSREALEATGYFDPDGVIRERAAQIRYPRMTPKRIIMDLSLTSRRRDPALAPHLPGRQSVRPARLDPLADPSAYSPKPRSVHSTRGNIHGGDLKRPRHRPAYFTFFSSISPVPCRMSLVSLPWSSLTHRSWISESLKNNLVGDSASDSCFSLLDRWSTS